MSTTQSTAEVSGSSSSRKGGLPLGVSVALILVAIGGGGWFVWNFWKGLQTAGAGSVVSVDETPQEYQRTIWGDVARQRQQDRVQQQLNAADYVRERPRAQGGGWEIKGGRTRVTVMKFNNRTRINADSLDPTFITAEARQLLALRARGANEDAVAKHLKLTDDQRKALNAIPRGAGYTITDPLRQTLERLFAEWETAAEGEKAAKADALTKAVRELEAEQAEKTKAELASRAQKVKEIVTEEQIKAFADMGRAGGGGAPAAPAAPGTPAPGR